MNIKSKRVDGILVVKVEGRLDAYGSLELDKSLEKLVMADDLSVVFDLDGVDYLSSGGIRSFLIIEKMLRGKGGHVRICNVNHYPLEVLKMAGFDQIFSMHPTMEDALKFNVIPSNSKSVDWNSLPKYYDENVSLTILNVSHGDTNLKVVGDICKVLYASLGEQDIYSRKFSDTEYSIGLGGLGEKNKDFIEIMGEMMTIGGTMVWLPTDGHETPDFLIPAKDTGRVTIHTGFNAALDGDFNDIILVRSKKDNGLSMAELYSAIFTMARDRRPSFKGIVSVAMQADITEFYSSGIKISPIKKFTPLNSEMITDKDNIDAWLNINNEPLFNGETMVSFGVGVDLTSDLSPFDETVLSSLFYLHPANIVNQEMLLHNHAVVFKHLPIEKNNDLNGHIHEIVKKGEFLDMHHILDNTRIEQAIMGVSYISEIHFE